MEYIVWFLPKKGWIMGAVFGVIFLAILALLGLIGLSIGIVGLILSLKAKKAGKSRGKTFSIVFAMVLVSSILLTTVPAGFFTFIVLVNTLPPEGFVETAIVIEEDGYQDTTFTADGVTYRVLPLEVYDMDLINTPVFTYKTQGFLNGSQCGNYYALPNSQNFNLVSDEFGLLFCPVEEWVSVVDYYQTPSHLQAYYDNSVGDIAPMPAHEYSLLDNYIHEELDSLQREQLFAKDYQEFSVVLLSQDGAVFVESHWFVVNRGQVYYTHIIHPNGDSYADTQGDLLVVNALPPNLSSALLALYQNQAES